MDKKAAKIRAEKLRNEINDLRYRYHVLDDPAVTDEVYDLLTQELLEIEKEHPGLATPDSPPQRVGGRALDKFLNETYLPLLEAELAQDPGALENNELFKFVDRPDGQKI